MKIAALILVIIVLYFYIRGFSMLDNALFGKKNEATPQQPQQPQQQGVTWSSMVFYITITLGGILGFSWALYYMLTEGGNIYALGFRSWGLIGNITPYLLFLTISIGVVLAFARETTLMRRILRSIFMIFSGLVGFAGGFVGSMVVISFLFVWVLGKLFDAITRHKFASTPSPVEAANFNAPSNNEPNQPSQEEPKLLEEELRPKD